MKPIDVVKFDTKDKLYKYINVKLTGLIGDERDWLANLSNAVALLNTLMDDVNWVGFYLVKKGELVLGPFQGKPACIRIEIGRGVCGAAALTKDVQCVENVHDFPGHIACDSASNSEIVLPIVKDGQVVAVLDIDSPLLGRFDTEDQMGLERIVHTLTKYVDWAAI